MHRDPFDRDPYDQPDGPSSQPDERQPHEPGPTHTQPGGWGAPPPPLEKAPAKRPWYRRTWVLVAGALLFGFIAGSGNAGAGTDDTEDAEPAPRRADVVTAEPEPATPGSCLQVIDFAEAGNADTPEFAAAAADCRSKAAAAPAPDTTQPDAAAAPPATSAPETTDPPATTAAPQAAAPEPAPEPDPPATQAAPDPPPTEAQNCDPSYPDVCIPPYPPDLNCDDVEFRRFTVQPPDPHGFDADEDGVGCEWD